MRNPIKTFSFGLLAILLLITVSQYIIKINRIDNLEIQTATASILKKEIQPEGNYQQYHFVGKTMRSFTVHKIKEFQVYANVNGEETSYSVPEEDFNHYKIDEKIVIKFVELGFPKKIVIIDIAKK